MSTSTSEDIVIIDSSDYAQVVFEDVNECFSHCKPLECEFTLNELLTGSDSIDWIGIYKVGFSDCSDYTCNLPVDKVTDNKGKVVFPIEILPKEDGEFYQFVYVSNGKQIRGASVPFQFKLDESSEYTDEEDNDAVIVKFETVETAKSITDMKERCVQLSTDNQVYEKLVRDNEGLIKTLKDEVASIKLRCFRLTMDNEKLNFTLRNKADSLKNLAETISSLTNDNNSLQDRFNDLSNDNKNLLDSLQERIDQVGALKTELESAKISKGEFEEVLSLKQTELLQLEKDKNELSRIVEELHLINETIQKLETQVTERTEELDQIKADLRKNNVIVAEQAEIIQTILSEKDDITRMVDTLKQEMDRLQSVHMSTTEELEMTKDKLTAAEQCKEMLRSQLDSVTSELEESKKGMSVQRNVANELTGRLAQTEYEKSSFNEKLDQFKAEYQEKLNQINGSYYVLRVAHNSLETRLKSSEQRREIAERELETLKNNTSQDQIRKENEELKDRVRCGAYEYTKLFEKLRLLKNQKFNNELNVYHGMSNSNSQDDNKLTRRRSHITSTQNETQETCSQVDRASADSDNTLLDALLGSSFYNGTWKEDTTKQNTQTNTQTNTPVPAQYTSQPQKIQAKIVSVAKNVATIIQPVKSSQTSDMSDDGLMSQLGQQKNNKVRKVEENLSQKLSRCQIGGGAQNSSQASKTRDMNCQDCGFVFPTGMKDDDLAYHMSSHHEQTCPVCDLQFDKGYSQQEFESHVDSHFSN